jgi:hypothetical protein
VGSSRVQRSINPNLLFNGNKTENIYNVSVASSTFFHNIVFSEYLINNFKPKDIYIELSPIIYNLNPAHIKFKINNLPYIRRYLHIIDLFDFAESYIFYWINLKDTLKNIVFPNQNLADTIGFISNDQNGYKKTDSFLKKKDLELNFNQDISRHKELIRVLMHLAKENNTKIHFFLPLTYRKQLEKEIVVTVYQSLAKELKINYSEDFLKQISKPEYLYDNLHLNTKGAVVTSAYFKENYFQPRK